MTTAVPAPTLGPNGFIAPQASDILDGCVADVVGAFGGGLNPSLATPQGQLASSLAAIYNNVMQTFLNLTQQFDPAYNFGRYQDAIARIYFLERKPPLPTVVEGTCLGAVGTVIPIGSLALAADGNVYESLAAGTIGASGTCLISFQCTVEGSIGCPAGALNQIYQAIPGWDSITNVSDGVIGQEVESRRDFEIRRFDSVANNALGFLAAVQGAVWKVDGVTDIFVTENFTTSPVTIRGVSVPANSLYASVTGGAAPDVAKAIWTKKAPGCNTAGNTTVTVYDDVNGYDPPLPSYVINFETPVALPILFNANLANNPQIPANAQDLISSAIVNAFDGSDGTPRARIASTIYASTYYASIAKLGTWAQIIALQIGSSNVPVATITGSIGGTGTVSVLSVSALSGGTIAVGQYVSGTVGGTSVQEGTVILAQLSGSAGGTGTYSVSVKQTIGSGTLQLSLPNANSVVCRMDEQPVTGPSVITVTIT